MKISVLITLLLLLPAAWVTASSVNNPQEMLVASESLQLSSDPRWLKLIHYRKTLWGNYSSIVDDEQFFLAKDGKNNPSAELEATIQLFLNENAEQKVRACRFPARLKFLQTRLFDQFDFHPEFECKEFDDWREESQTEEVWMIFPSSYINSPSSMFGHTLLRLDPPDSAGTNSKLLSKAVNYAAKVDGQPNGFAYAYKGLFGGYPGYFSMMAYYEKVKEYNRIENRDVWEYKLNASADEIDWLIRHIWELDKIRFDYYFVTQNCSYQLLSLLDVMRPTDNLTRPFEYVAIPVDTVRILHQKAWIEEQNFRPSKASEFRDFANTLTKEERDFVVKFKKHAYEELEGELARFPAERQPLILESAYKLIRLNKKTKKQRKKSLTLLNARSQLGKTQIPVEQTAPEPPEVGHFSRRVSIGASIDDDEKVKALIDFKIAYHSIEDPIRGFDKDSQINFLHGRLDVSESKTQLERFDILNIRSLSPSDQFFSRMAWQVNTGWKRELFAADRKLARQLNAEFGRVYSLGNVRLSGLLGAQLEHHSLYDQNLQIGPRLDLGIIYQSNRFSFESHNYYTYYDESGLSRLHANLSSSYHLTQNASLNFGYSYVSTNNDNDWQEFKLQMNFYY